MTQKKFSTDECVPGKFLILFTIGFVRFSGDFFFIQNKRLVNYVANTK